MSQVIAVSAIKGGTGKTTTSASLAQASKKSRKKVLCIDLDPQANLTSYFRASQDEPGAYDILHGASITEVIQETSQGIDIVAGNSDLSTEVPKTGSIFRLSEAIKPVIRKYDLIIIDTPPAFSEMTFEALQASNGLIVAAGADIGSLQGMFHIVDIAKEVKKTNKKLKVLGTVICNYNERPLICRKMHEAFEEQGRENKCPVIATIRRGIVIPEAQALGRNLFDYAPKSKPAEDYMKLYKLIMSNERKSKA